ncbi:phospholipid-binding lipoprotein MlaA [Novosphingobium sp. PhB165]|uniref:MlaA family lipoprotein n=1 Tax=Novosphingobium sp. PhB165 TaxID=2485105 RepID=UPI00104385DC|nr:VacJ family lipoprotein [Novosphingobium sp. PhB165]TCM16064.1 phospholipid-binding lipoprotein MlaA [Novosphingobium sp. PhB165]
MPVALLAASADLSLPYDAVAQVEQPADSPPPDDTPVTVPPPAPEAIPADAAAADPAPVTDALPDPAEEVATEPADDIEADEIRAERDPLEGFNRTMFGIYEAMDKAIWRPAAMGYEHIVPKPVRSGIHNLISNLTEPFVFVNFLLQAKPGKAMETLARFTINTTLGIGGLFDVAKTKDFNLPYRPNGFGTTLAIYGVKSGPYLFIPFMGPTTLRDALSNAADDSLLPLAIGKPFSTWEYQLSTGVADGLEIRAEADPELRTLLADAIDPYATLRSVYLQNRAAEIEEIRGKHKPKAGNAPAELGDPLDDPAGATARPAPSDAPELHDPLLDPARN